MPLHRSPRRHPDGQPTSNCLVTCDHGRNTKAAGLDYRGNICTAIVPKKASELKGTLGGVVTYDVPTHVQGR